jgi:predicted TPR repeat methyltransferase
LIRYRKAVAADSKHAWAWLNLGSLLKDKRGDAAAGAAAYRKGLEIEPSHQRADEIRAILNRM